MTIKTFLSNILLIIFLILGFLYRIYGLNNNYSFWTDENHVAIFARAILERGQPVLANGFSTEAYQWLQYWLSAISSFFFGLNEFAIRLPSVFFGVLSILAVYLLGIEIFNRKVGLLSAFFITFLNIEILFSRQARPYQALQFFYLLSIWFVYKLVKEKKFNLHYFWGFLGCGILASLMHGLGLIIFFLGFIYLLIFKTSWFGKKWILLGMLLFVLFSWIFKTPLLSVVSEIGKTNNLFYYRFFLTHNYLSLCLLAFIGGFLLFLRKKYRELFLFTIVIGIQIVIDSFILGQPFIRYFYPVFGFIIIIAVYGLDNLSFLLSNLFRKGKIFQIALLLFLVVIIIPNNKFTLFPKQSYSLNEDMQEIPEVDWKNIYGFVDDRLKQNPGSILVTNWSDLPVWYLGEGKLDYILRKVYNVKNDSFSNAQIISSEIFFEQIVKANKKGILVIDSWDNQVPDGVREFSRNNLKKQLEVDRLYPTQPRYWPVSVYSWGI